MPSAPGTHVVRISFKGTGLDVEVIPVHYYGDADDRGYLIERETGRRVLTSIPLHLRFIRTRKEKQNRHFAQLIRFVKWWVRRRKSEDSSFRFKSFMVEMLWAHLVDGGIDVSDYPAALEGFFGYVVKSQLRERIAFTDYYSASKLPGPTSDPIEIFDPVNPENNVGSGYTDADRRRIVDSAEEALDTLAEARYAITKGRAVECWRDILGPSF